MHIVYVWCLILMLIAHFSVLYLLFNVYWGLLAKTAIWIDIEFDKKRSHHHGPGRFELFHVAYPVSFMTTYIDINFKIELKEQVVQNVEFKVFEFARVMC